MTRQRRPYWWNPDRCINCASSALACPYDAICFHQNHAAPPGKTIAAKCDARISGGGIPACVEVCKSGSLTFKGMAGAYHTK